MNINGTLSDILEILSGVPQGLILGPILFNIFINDFLLHIKSTNTHNYADDNTLSAFDDTAMKLKNLKKRQQKRRFHGLHQTVCQQMPINSMLFLLEKIIKSTAGISLMIDSEEIKSEYQVKLVGVLNLKKLSYNEYISTCLKQASPKLNSIKRLGNFISKRQKKTLCYS